MIGESAAVSPFRRPLGVTLYFASHVVAALLLALPTSALVAGTGVGRFPEGDRSLFQPGGIVAAEVARQIMPTLPAHFASSLAAGTLVAMLLTLPHAALLVTLSERERAAQRSVWGRAVGHVPTLVSLSGLALLAQVIVLFATSSLAAALDDSLRGATERSADLASLAVFALGLVASIVLGLVRDLGRAAAVRDGLAGKAALLAGFRAFAGAPGRALLGWLTPALAGVALVAVGAALTTLFDVSRPGNFRVLAVFVLHQAIAFALCFCRAFWLAASLGIVARTSSQGAFDAQAPSIARR
ncbi:MAG TPA: hypothetical protein VF103_13130 [Polyangiaceae bacterium]